MKFHKTCVFEENQHGKSLSNALYISSATARVAPDLLKALAILSDKTVRKFVIDRENLRRYWKSEKKATFFWVINNPIIYKFFKDFTNHRKKTNKGGSF